jgi:opacity protein-like surface antigen
MKSLFFSSILFLSVPSWALNYEFGLSFANKKNSFDKDNYFETESSTASASIYFSEQIALELSYTDAKAKRNEKPAGGNTTETFQRTEVIGADLIYVLVDRKSWIQPYIKGGMAQLKRSQTVFVVESNDLEELDIETAVIPSYGAGIKINITKSLSVRISYDVWQTPVGGGTTSNDSQMRAGLSWML